MWPELRKRDQRWVVVRLECGVFWGRLGHIIKAIGSPQRSEDNPRRR